VHPLISENSISNKKTQTIEPSRAEANHRIGRKEKSFFGCRVFLIFNKFYFKCVEEEGAHLAGKKKS